jgi:quercetin dioxygenase-like cupin family protein
MSDDSFIKNMEFSKPMEFVNMVQYQEGQVVSRTLAQNRLMSMTLFAFTAGEGLSTHTASGAALVQILDGEAQITIGETALTVKAGEAVAMPPNVPHSLHARTSFKMFLVVVKGE